LRRERGVKHAVPSPLFRAVRRGAPLPEGRKSVFDELRLLTTLHALHARHAADLGRNDRRRGIKGVTVQLRPLDRSPSFARETCFFATASPQSSATQLSLLTFWENVKTSGRSTAGGWLRGAELCACGGAGLPSFVLSSRSTGVPPSRARKTPHNATGGFRSQQRMLHGESRSPTGRLPAAFGRLLSGWFFRFCCRWGRKAGELGPACQ
jgi:hypothetical protein